MGPSMLRWWFTVLKVSGDSMTCGACYGIVRPISNEKASHLAVLHTQEQKKLLSCFASEKLREPVISISTKIEFYDVNDWTLVDSLANAASRGASPAPWEEIATHAAYTDIPSGRSEINLGS